MLNQKRWEKRKCKKTCKSRVPYPGKMSVMVNFTCQPDWAKDAQKADSIISGYVCEGVSRRHQHLNWQTEERTLPSAMWPGIL